MTTPCRGLHESLVTDGLAAAIDELDANLEAKRERLLPAEAPDRIALHLSRVVHRAIGALPERERVEASMRLVRDLIELIGDRLAIDDLTDDRPVKAGEVLAAVYGQRLDGGTDTIEPPLTPLLDTTLLTNSPDEPRVGRQLLAEIQSADRIDVVMAFIRRTGIRPMLAALKTHCEHGRALRILTTTFTGTTELAALEQLAGIGAEVLVSYDTTMSRLHAKAWHFHRESGYSTAYIGSSNLTHSAQVTGLEWNVRISGARNPDVIDKMSAVFDSYWNGGDFVPFNREQFVSLAERTTTGPRIFLSPVELRPEPFQARMLELIAVARQKGHHHNLLVSATGTGKTVMAALDYVRLRAELPRSRLLFVAHRKEILEQSLATFRHALRNEAFGELWVGGDHPARFDHVFASIQSLNAADLAHLPPDHYDVVIVDEFHHAAAASYRRLLEHILPLELLGLTATPERTDNLSVLDHFGGRIAAELRLWHAIDQHRLCPFLYYGIADGTDLREVPWRRGRGYDIDALTRVLTANASAARHVLGQIQDHVDDIGRVRCLGFCVSVAHAHFMARVFQDAGVKAVAVSGDTPRSERQAALRGLDRGDLQVLFSVDLFNEGIDIPDIDTVLFLRPTDSATLFLQQLGRGLRKSPNKTACTVLDFVGQHRKEFRFDRRFGGLFPGSRKDLRRRIETGFPVLPAGCHMELDAVASKRVLENIKASLPSRWADKVAELHRIAETTPERNVDLATFLEESELLLEDVYQGNRGWSDLRDDAGLPNAAAGPNEGALRRACGRLLHVDDLARLDAYQSFLAHDTVPRFDSLSIPQRRLLRMLTASIVDQSVDKNADLMDGVRVLWKHPQVRTELRQLFQVLRSRIDHLHTSLAAPPETPLEIHARYTRIEILAALGDRPDRAKVAAWQTGVRWLEHAQSDVFAFTLDKTSGNFSPTTRYRDYAINRELIHWESQGVVRADSDTGRRYRDHVARGSTVLLFARTHATDRAFWFLGPATSVQHRSERPMQVTWKLKVPLPGDLYVAFAAAVA